MSYLDDAIKNAIDSIFGRLEQDAGRGGGAPRGGGPQRLANLPELPEVPGLEKTSEGGYKYTPQDYPGINSNQMMVANAAGVAAARAVNAMVAALPQAEQAAQYHLAQTQAAAFGSFSSLSASEGAGYRMMRNGTPINSTDAAVALQRAGLLGYGNDINAFGGRDINTYRQSLTSISNIMPGLGLSGASDVYSTMQAGRNVNMAKLIGVQLRDQAGHPRSMDDVVNQLWAQLNQRKSVSRPIQKSDITFALLPGNSLDYTLNQYFGANSDVRQTIIQMLYAKASGVPDFSKQSLLGAGFTTEYNIKQGEAAASAAKVLQNLSPALEYGAESATGIQTFFNYMLAGSGPLGSLFGFAKGLLGRATGGPVNEKQPYIVGEKGPEVFVPKTDGVIIPNHELPDSVKNGMGTNITTSSASLNFTSKYSDKTSKEDIADTFSSIINKVSYSGVKRSEITADFLKKFLETQGSDKSPGRSGGGEVSAGSKYIVGESGKEAFVPSSPQTVNYGGVKIEITVPASFTEDRMVRELQKALSVAEIERKARMS